MAVLPAPLVEKVIDELGGRGIDARNLFEIGEAGARNRLGRPERMQQGALARRPDPADLVERALGEVLLAAGAVGADGEAMRLVAQPLHEIKRRIARRESERRSVGEEKGLASGVAIDAFGDRRDRDALDAECGEDFARRRELAEAAVDEDQVGPLRKSLVPVATRPLRRRAPRTPPSSSRAKRRRNTSRIMAVSSPATRSSPLMLKVR